MTDDLLIAALCNHFPGDLEILLRILHLRVQITREREKKPRPLF